MLSEASRSDIFASGNGVFRKASCTLPKTMLCENALNVRTSDISEIASLRLCIQCFIYLYVLLELSTMV